MKKLTFVFSFLMFIAVLTGLVLFPVVALHASESKSEHGAKPEKAEKGEHGAKSEKAEGEGEGKGKDKDKEKESTITGGRFAGDPVYVHLRPFYLPVVTDTGAEQIVTLLVDLNVKDLDMADNFYNNMPRVRDALMQVLYGGLGNGTLRNGSFVDIVKIKAKILRALQKVMGKESVDEVLIQAVAQRKM